MGDNDCKDCVYMKSLSKEVDRNTDDIKRNSDEIKDLTKLVNKLVKNQAVDNKDQSNLYNLVVNMDRKVDKAFNVIQETNKSFSQELKGVSDRVTANEKKLALNDKDTVDNKNAIDSLNDLKMAGLLKLLTISFLVISFLSSIVYVIINLIIEGGGI